MDAISGIKPWDQTTAMLRQDLTLIDAHINSKGWKWLSENRLWSGPNDKMNLSLENKN
jgi:hypothetical protein